MAFNPDFSSTLSLLFAAAVLAQWLLRAWLASRQVRHVARHRAEVPEAFAQRISLAAHQKAADYTLAKARIALIEMTLGAVVLLAWTLLGGLDALNQWLLELMGAGLWQQLALLAGFALISGLVELPLSPQAEPSSSGTYFVTSAWGSMRPSWASCAAIRPVNDLVTENSRCGELAWFW